MVDGPVWAGPSVDTRSQVLTRVGWYCAGGHPGVQIPGVHLDHDRTAVGPSLRFEDPCEHGIPVYALLTAEQVLEAERLGHGRC